MGAEVNRAPRTSGSLFVSYSRADWHYVELIVAEIRRCGISTWVDIENILPGAHWKEAVADAIDAASALMLCISPLCLESGRTLTELRKAIGRGKVIIPVMVERVEYEELPREIRERQVIEVWQEPPAAGALRASRLIAGRLGGDVPPAGRDAQRGRIANLILTLGDAEAEPVRGWLRAHATTSDEAVVERTVHSLEDFALVERWIGAATAVHVVVGENVAPDVCAFLLGYVNAVVGSASMCAISERPHPTAEAIGAALPIRCRSVDELGLPDPDSVETL